MQLALLGLDKRINLERHRLCTKHHLVMGAEVVPFGDLFVPPILRFEPLAMANYLFGRRILLLKQLLCVSQKL